MAASLASWPARRGSAPARSAGHAASASRRARCPRQCPRPPPVDPIVELIAAADRHFEAGRRELTLGHLARAKTRFNQALEVLLESPQGARANPRVREHFDRLVDRIAALELTALATGDGFTERTTEPASIDELLAISTFDTAPTAATAENVQADLAADEPRHSDPAQRPRAALRRALPGPAARVPGRRAWSAARSTCR